MPASSPEHRRALVRSLVAEGLQNTDIARRLDVTPETVAADRLLLSPSSSSYAPRWTCARCRQRQRYAGGGLPPGWSWLGSLAVVCDREQCRSRPKP